MLGSLSLLIHTGIFQAQPPLPAQLLTQVWGSAKLTLPRARGSGEELAVAMETHPLCHVGHTSKAAPRGCSSKAFSDVLRAFPAFF